MTKTTLSELIDAFASAAGLTKKEAEQMLHVLPEVIREGLKSHGMVKIKDFGTFKVKRVEVRKGRNIKTGEEVIVPSQNKVTFTADPSMRDFINKFFKDLDYVDIETEEPKPVPPEEKPLPVEPPRVEKPANIADEVKPSVVFDKKEEPPTVVYPPVDLEEKTEEFAEEFSIPDKPIDVEDLEVTEPKSKYLWIIPAVIGVVIILLIIFYFRACKDTVTPVREEPPVIENEMPVAPETPAAGNDSAIMETDSVPVSDTTMHDTASSPATPVIPTVTETPERASGESYKVQPGNYLYQMAGQFYGDSALWVLIYKANQELIPNPDGNLVGKELFIPNLEGDADHLTRNDSMNISEGYRLLYEYYAAKNDPVAPGFKWATGHFKPR